MEAQSPATENRNKGDNNSSKVPLCCQGCVRWASFGKRCWYYWEGKKHCTMWTSSFNEM